MNKVMMPVAEVAALIEAGHYLALAADEGALRKLPRGHWIGGSIPYFVGDDGGMQSRDLIYVSRLDAAGRDAAIVSYTPATISQIAVEAPDNGFTLLIIPALSPIHTQYAKEARDYEDLFMKPVIGWISGVHLDDLGKVSPTVFNGLTGEVFTDRAVAMHVPLPSSQLPVIRILNLFRQGAGDTLTFTEDGFAASTCRVNGVETDFARYVADKGIDLTLPLVADYNGAQINTSFQGVDSATGVVSFYAPVFAGIEYRQAAPVGDYVRELEGLAAGRHARVEFSCNCILNFLYGKLEGRKTGDLTGPMTFGEIGYQLLNQTLVYLEVLEG